MHSSNYQQSQKGFTLLELLIVIAIIGLLSSIVLVGVNKARISGFNAIRTQNHKSVRSALQLYLSDYGPTAFYTLGASSLYHCLSPAGTTCRAGVSNGALQNLLAPYINELPKDPHVVDPEMIYMYLMLGNGGANKFVYLYSYTEGILNEYCNLSPQYYNIYPTTYGISQSHMCVEALIDLNGVKNY